jgi:Flp pilus assembly CpaE family ATPase
VDHLRYGNELTIFDGDAFTAQTIEIAHRADHVFIVAPASVAAALDVTRYLDMLGRDPERQKLIITRTCGDMVNPESIHAKSGIPLLTVFPNLAEPISSAINLGVPIPKHVRAFHAALSPVLEELGVKERERPANRFAFFRKAKS